MSWVYSDNKKTADFLVNTNVQTSSEWLSGDSGWYYLNKKNWENQDTNWENWSKDSTGSFTSPWSPDPWQPYQSWEIQDVYFSSDLRLVPTNVSPFYQYSDWIRDWERCFLINNDGTKVWTGHRVQENPSAGPHHVGLYAWELSTPYDLETATHSQLEVIFPGIPINRPTGIAWGKDGEALYVWIEDANTSSTIYYYDLDTPPYVLSEDQPSVKQIGTPDLSWSLSPTNNGIGLDIHPEAGYVFFNKNGGVDDDIARLTMTNGIIDSTTPDQILQIPDIPVNQSNTDASIRVFDNGTKMSIAARDGNVFSGGKWEDNIYGINFYSLSVPYDLTSTVTLLKHISLAEDPEATPGNRISWIGGVGSGQYWSPDGAWMLDASSLNSSYHFLKLDFRGN